MRAKYENLRVWSEAMDLTEQVYIATRDFPRREDFVLTAQLRRSASSIPANIAEGCGRFHTREFLHFLYVARGSLFELMTHLTLASRLGYLSQPKYEALRGRSEKLLIALSGLIRSIERRVQ